MCVCGGYDVGEFVWLFFKGFLLLVVLVDYKVVVLVLRELIDWFVFLLIDFSEFLWLLISVVCIKEVFNFY